MKKTVKWTVAGILSIAAIGASVGGAFAAIARYSETEENSSKNQILSEKTADAADILRNDSEDKEQDTSSSDTKTEMKQTAARSYQNTLGFEADDFDTTDNDQEHLLFFSKAGKHIGTIVLDAEVSRAKDENGIYHDRISTQLSMNSAFDGYLSFVGFEITPSHPELVTMRDYSPNNHADATDSVSFDAGMEIDEEGVGFGPGISKSFDRKALTVEAVPDYEANNFAMLYKFRSGAHPVERALLGVLNLIIDTDKLMAQLSTSQQEMNATARHCKVKNAVVFESAEAEYDLNVLCSAIFRVPNGGDLIPDNCILSGVLHVGSEKGSILSTFETTPLLQDALENGIKSFGNDSSIPSAETDTTQNCTPDSSGNESKTEVQTSAAPVAEKSLQEQETEKNAAEQACQTDQNTENSRKEPEGALNDAQQPDGAIQDTTEQDLCNSAMTAIEEAMNNLIGVLNSGADQFSGKDQNSCKYQNVLQDGCIYRIKSLNGVNYIGTAGNSAAQGTSVQLVGKDDSSSLWIAEYDAQYDYWYFRLKNNRKLVLNASAVTPASKTVLNLYSYAEHDTSQGFLPVARGDGTFKLLNAMTQTCAVEVAGELRNAGYGTACRLYTDNVDPSQVFIFEKVT